MLKKIQQSKEIVPVELHIRETENTCQNLQVAEYKENTKLEEELTETKTTTVSRRLRLFKIVGLLGINIRCAARNNTWTQPILDYKNR
jgi:hypothetical protein